MQYDVIEKLVARVFRAGARNGTLIVNIFYPPGARVDLIIFDSKIGPYILFA